MRSLSKFFPTPGGLAVLGLVIGLLLAADVYLAIKLAVLLPLSAYAIVCTFRWATSALGLYAPTGRRAAATVEAVDDDF